MNLYNNKFFEYLKLRETEGFQKRLAKEGLAISNEEQYQKHLMENAKTTFWVLIGISLFIIYSISNYLFRLMF